MSNFTITIEAPEICEAIKALAAALFGKQASPATMPAPTPAAPVNPILTAVPSFAAAPTTPPVQTTAPAAVPAPSAPIPTATTLPPATPAANSVPTAAAPTYTTEQLAIAATQLVDAGRRNELVDLLKSFGAAALTFLPKEKYGDFATSLRGMGAKI